MLCFIVGMQTNYDYRKPQDPRGYTVQGEENFYGQERFIMIERIRTVLMKNPEIYEIGVYIFWGILSAFLNIGLFLVLIKAGMTYGIANLITLVILRIFVFLTNKYFVFKTRAKDIKALLTEIISFIITRSFTALIDFFGLILWVEVFKWEPLVGKIIIAVIVIILNYILSKYFTFKKKEE